MEKQTKTSEKFDEVAAAAAAAYDLISEHDNVTMVCLILGDDDSDPEKSRLNVKVAGHPIGIASIIQQIMEGSEDTVGQGILRGRTLYKLLKESQK